MRFGTRSCGWSQFCWSQAVLLPSSSRGDSVQDADVFGGSWHESDDHGAATDEAGSADEGGPYHDSCGSDACSHVLEEERAEWLDRYWHMGARTFREGLLQEANKLFPKIAIRPVPECFCIEPEPQPAAQAADCRQQ